MTKGQFHLTPDGPAECAASERLCPYGETGHYTTLEEAAHNFEEFMGGAVPEARTKIANEETVTLSLDEGFERVTVVNGDLSDSTVRSYFADGLCGDLANSIHAISGGKVFFSLDISDAEEYNAETLQKLSSLDDLPHFVFHAVVESKHNPGMYLDAYGVKSAEEIEAHFGGPLVEAPEHIFKDFHSGETHDVSGFAATVLAMDASNTAIAYD